MTTKGELTASEMAKKRWARISPAERRKIALALVAARRKKRRDPRAAK